MNRWQKTAGTALLLVMVTAAPAWADSPTIARQLPSGVVTSDAQLSVQGKLTRVDLEGGYYAVDGWMLKGDPALFTPYLDQDVVVTGTAFAGAAMQMVRTLDVTGIRAKDAPAVPTTEPVVVPIMVPAPLQSVPAQRTLPTAVTVAGHPVTFDQQPLLRDGVLMVPLRAVVEAAGGQVQWDGAEQKIVVTLGDRTASLAIGSANATTALTQAKQQTPVQMARQPELVGARTLISADALSSLLGLREQSSLGNLMALQATPAVAAPAPAEAGSASDQAITESSGTIQQVEAGAITRILVTGAPMANGEPRLTWVTVTGETRITVQEQGQERAGTVADLKIGQQVDVQVTGGVLMSYPAQATGLSILVRK